MNDESMEIQSDPRETILRAFSQAMGDSVRLKIAARLAVQPQSIPELSGSLQLPLEELQQPLDQLVEIGLARLENDRYRLDDTALAAWKETVHSGRKRDLPVQEQEAGDAFERKTLRDFLRQDGSIKSFPSQEKKFLVLVRYALQAFELGERYTEKQVNQLLRRYHPDTALLRRTMVDYKYMARQDGIYWLLDS